MNYFLHVGNPGTATTLSAPGYTVGNTSINVASTANFPADTDVIFGIDTATISTGSQVRTVGSYCVFSGKVASVTSIGSLTLLSGTPQNYAASALTRVYITVSSQHTNRLVDGILAHANQDGSLKTTAVQTALGLGASTLNGWNALGYAPNTVVANGNRSYTLTFNGVDLTPTLSAGMRLRASRTVAAPTQSTSLNGTTQYYSKTSPAGMTFTDDFTVSAWIKLSSYGSGSHQAVISRFNGTSGFILRIEATTGQVTLVGFNAGSANFSQVQSYQSISLNKWVHVTAQLDMSTFTATTTTSYIMIDGVDVPASVSRGGTNPTALVQAGSLEIGSYNGGTNLFNGKIAQAAVYSAKVTQATIGATGNQGLAGTETSLVSAYSFNASTSDLNTTNANNLTSNGSAVTTNADSPFGGQADGMVSSTLDYAIIQKSIFSTNTTLTVQVPEGCTIPTSSGVASVVYSSNKTPYDFPASRRKWQIETLKRTSETIATGTGGSYVASNHTITLPLGSWCLTHDGAYAQNNSSSGFFDYKFRLNGAASGAIDDSMVEIFCFASGTDFGVQQCRNSMLELTAQEVYTLQSGASAGGGTTTTRIRGDLVTSALRAENAYL